MLTAFTLLVGWLVLGLPLSVIVGRYLRWHGQWTRR